MFEIQQILRLLLFLGPKITFVCKFSKPCDRYYLVYSIYPNLPKFGPWWRHNEIVKPDIYIFRSSYPFFELIGQFWLRNSISTFRTGKDMRMLLKQIYWKSIEIYTVFLTLGFSDVLHRGKILLAFEMRWQISKL